MCLFLFCLEVGIIEPNTVMDTLAVKLCTGNKRMQGKLIKIISAEEESMFYDRRLSKEGRKRSMRVNHLNEVWIEEVENKINIRDTEILNDE